MKTKNYFLLLLISILTYSCQGTPNGKANEVLNILGDVESIEQVSLLKGDTTNYISYEISKNRDIIKVIEQSKTFSGQRISTFKYNENRDVLRKTSVRNNWTEYLNNSYDKNGYLTESIENSQNGIEYKRNIYENDDLGRIVKHQIVNNGLLLQQINLYQYDSTANYTKKYLCNNYQDTILTIIPTYDNGKIVKKSTLNKLGEIVITTQLTYTDKGLLAQEEIYSTEKPDAEIKQITVYKFDNNGNWTEKVTKNLPTGDVLEAIKRTIIYY